MFGRNNHDCDKDDNWGPWKKASVSGVKALAALVGVDHNGEAWYRKCLTCGNEQTK